MDYLFFILLPPPLSLTRLACTATIYFPLFPNFEIHHKKSLDGWCILNTCMAHGMSATDGPSGDG